jgi:hypothetical protein
MPRNKDLKRLVRARMQRTGESYTSSRAQLLKKRSRRDRPPLPAGDPAQLAGMSDAAVRAKTGRTWRQWVHELDAAGALTMSHRDIARHLRTEHDLTAWWSQTVTVGYERIRGLRDVGQRRGGGYEANKSKTFPVDVRVLYRAWSEKRRRERWLPETDLTVRTSRREQSMRLAWPDDTSVEVTFVAKGEDKSQVTIQHRKLASRKDRDRRKAYWAERLAALGRGLVAAKRG